MRAWVIRTTSVRHAPVLLSQVNNPRLRSLEARVRLEGMGGYVLAEDGTYCLQGYV